MRPLGDLPPEALRAHLHRVADWIADYRGGLARRRLAPAACARGDVARRLPVRLGDAGVPLAELLDAFEAVVVPGLVHWGHPAFFGYFGSTTTGPGIVAEALAAALNVSAMMWSVSPAATEVEEVVLRWLRDLVGLPDRFEGMVYEGASTATLHALAAAREVAGGPVRRDGLRGERYVVYASEEAHSSIDKAAIVLGLGERAVRRLPVDDVYRLDPHALAAAITDDRRAGRRPCAVVATVGTTETAAVDPVPAIAEICRREGVWLHVDAAYGGALAVLPEGRWAMAGVERADSVVVNAHKWLFVPFDFSALYSPRFDAVRAVFALTPAYLAADAGDGHDAMDVTLQLGRRFRALKAWMVWSSLGRDGLQARLRAHRRLAARLAAWIDAEPGFVVCAPVDMGVVCFRACADDPPDAADAANARIAAQVNASGAAWIGRTRLRGRVALRIALGNVLTTSTHVRRAWDLVRAAAADVSRRPPRARGRRAAGAARGCASPR